MLEASAILRCAAPLLSRSFSRTRFASSSKVTVEMVRATPQVRHPLNDLQLDNASSKRRKAAKKPTVGPLRAGFAMNPNSKPARRKGVGIEALSMSTVIEPEPEDASPSGHATNTTTDSANFQHRKLKVKAHPFNQPKTITPNAIQAAAHQGQLHRLSKLSFQELLALGSVADGSIVLVSRHMGLPPLGEDLEVGVPPERLATALLSEPPSKRDEHELKWLEDTALHMTSKIVDTTLDGAPAWDGKDPRFLVFRIAAYLGIPSSIIILQRLVDLGLVDEETMNTALREHPTDGNAVVRAALSRTAHLLDQPELAVELGGPQALIKAGTPATVLALVPAAEHPDASPEDVRQWMWDATRYKKFDALAWVWNKVRPRNALHVASHNDKVPTDGAAVGLMWYLLKTKQRGAARLLARDVLTGWHDLSLGFRARFIGMAASAGFAQSVRAGFDRYFGDEPSAGGLLMPWMAFRLISLFVSISELPEHCQRVPDALQFAQRVAARCFPLEALPRNEMHAALTARALFILAHASGTGPEDARELRMRAIRGVRHVLFEARPRRVPTTSTANILLHELAQHSPRRARVQLNRMRIADIGPDGVALSSVALAGAGDVLNTRRFGGLPRLTAKGQRGILRAVVKTRRGSRGALDNLADDCVRWLDEPQVRRWRRTRKKVAAQPPTGTST